MKLIKISCLFLFLVSSFGLVSCTSSAVGIGDSDRSTASIFISNASAAQASQATQSVFAEEGFSLRETSSSGRALRFQKVGGRAAYLAWGGWGGDQVWIVPEVWITQRGNGAQIDCDLYISTYSDHFGEHRVRRPMGAGSSAYRGVLRRIKARLKG